MNSIICPLQTYLRFHPLLSSRMTGSSLVLLIQVFRSLMQIVVLAGHIVGNIGTGEEAIGEIHQTGGSGVGSR